MEQLQWLLVYLKQTSEGNIFYERQLSLNYVHSTKTIYRNLTIKDLLCTENEARVKNVTDKV